MSEKLEMTIAERAAFALSILQNENLNIPSNVAKPMAEVQEWLEVLAGAQSDEQAT